MVITRVRSQRLPFVAHRADVRDHQFFAEVAARSLEDNRIVSSNYLNACLFRTMAVGRREERASI